MSNDAFIQLLLIVIIIEVIWSAIFLFLKISNLVPSVFFGLIVLQGLAIYAIDTAPAYSSRPSADLGGANLGPAILAGLIFWFSVLVWIFCLMVSVVSLVKKVRKK